MNVWKAPLRRRERIVVRETEESGEAELTLHLARNGVLFQYPHNNNFIFSNKKRADGILFLQRENDWEVMIVELKKTVKAKEWMKIKEQWHGAAACSGPLRSAGGPLPPPSPFSGGVPQGRHRRERS